MNGSKLCEWCGRLVATVEENKMYEIQRDGEGRLLKDYYSDNWVIGFQHFCRVRCPTCGVSVIIESGKIFERPTNLRDLKKRKPHEHSTGLQ